MIEVFCSDVANDIRLERPADGIARISIGVQHTVDQVMAAVGDRLSHDEAHAFRRLWSQDGVHRNYQRTPDGVLFTLADE